MEQIIKRKLAKRILILDGATGTQLQRQGMAGNVCPEKWCVENPGILSEVHKAYAASGADVIYTSTFGANRPKLSQYGIADVFEINKTLAGLAKRAVGKKALVAGDIGPTGNFVAPFGGLGFEEAVGIFKEQVKGLWAGGVDLFAVETMMDIQEARAALIAIKEVCGAFTIVTMTYDKSGRTLNGTDPLSALVTLQSLGADAVGCNCSSGPRAMNKIISRMSPYATVPLVAKPNAGMPKLIGKKTVFNMKPQQFASSGVLLAASGASIVGGCCGTTPEHIKFLKTALKKVRPQKPSLKRLAAISSARKTLVLENRKTICLVGEKINPTGKKKMQKELLAGNFSLVRSLAREQELSGAEALDVNMGVPGGNEQAMMFKSIELLSVVSDLPLVIDSSSPEVIEAALRIYPGRALVNSISGESGKLKKLLPLVKKYGAMFILLPLDSKKIPMTFKEKKNNVEKIFSLFKQKGFSGSDLVVDGLVMALSYYPNSALETCKTISWVSKKYRVNTVVGLSNISFGFPQRAPINREFLEMAKKNGLSMVIANPQDSKAAGGKSALRLLMAQDKDGRDYINKFSKISLPLKAKPKTIDTPAIQLLYQAVLQGDRQRVAELIPRALSQGVAPFVLMEEALIKAIIEVGNLFDKRKYFLPQLIASAEAMKRGIADLESFFNPEEALKRRKGLVVMATVSGDIHDIGKNIVSLMLKNHGFQIVDLGKDISASRVVSAVKRFKPDIVGLSALMTTTMVNMSDVVDLLRKEGLSCSVMIGGAVVTAGYARSLGVAYARDGVEAVRVAQGLCPYGKGGL
jgi:5-methyltetrahydrofolate--homocysteine methyltransferase